VKTCTNCHKKKKNAAFVEQCGSKKIVSFLCRGCRDKSRITQEQSNQLIKCIGERVLSKLGNTKGA
jgi:protein-arginine kinase activator protein McsA